MTFNSFVFIGFFFITYALYLLLRAHHRAQNYLLLMVSLIFYGYWDWRFLILLAFSCTVDYVAALGMERTRRARTRRWLLLASLISNLGLIAFFKYFHFFADSLVVALKAAGFSAAAPALRIVLPVGISFYTFQALSYTIDVYRGDIRAIKNYFDYMLFVTFFPHMVAGPIQLSRVLIPQVISPRRLNVLQIESGVALLVWGYFKKVVIADNCALVADQIFNHYTRYAGLDTVLGALAFTAQIYCDFSGYSDIARGLAKLMGFELMLNFNRPYFSLSPSDFWARWHISLSTWLRDYLYIPLGGNRLGKLLTYRNLLLTMVLGGLWHGAAWNYVLWGAYHGCLLVLYRLLDRRTDAPTPMSSVETAVRMALMFSLTVAGWVLFRSRSLDQISYIFTHAGLTTSKETVHFAFTLAYFTWPFIAFEAIQQVAGKPGEAPMIQAGWWARAPVYALAAAAIAIFGVREATEFIYFQF